MKPKSNLATFTFTASCLLAVAIFFCGNIFYQGMLFGRKAFIEVTDWGFALVPALLVVLFAKRSSWRSSFFATMSRRLWGHALSLAPSNQRGILITVVAGLGLMTLRVMLHRYWSFESGWDLAIYGQACSHHMISSLRDEQTLLADHFEPILLLVAPLCQGGHAPVLLLCLQAIAFIAGACGLWTLMQKQSWSFPSAMIVTAFFLLCTGNRGNVLYDFHPIVLSFAVIPWLIIALEKRRLFFVGLLALLLISLKETSALTLAGIGLFYGLVNRKERAKFLTGAVLAIAGFLSFFLIMKVAFPYFRGGAESLYFVKYYGYLGGSLGEVLKNFVTKPWIALGSLLQPAKINYLLKITAPFAFACFFRPIYLIPIVPALLVNMLSSHPYLYSARFHYEAEIYPWLFTAAVLLSRDKIFLRRWNKALAKTKLQTFFSASSYRIVWIGMLICFFSGKSLSWYASAYPTSSLQLSMRNFIDQHREKLSEQKVAVFEPMVPLFTNVSHLYLLERWRDADWAVIGFPTGKGSWIYSPEQIERDIIPEIGSSFDLVYQDSLYPTFRIYRRKGLNIEFP